MRQRFKYPVLIIFLASIILIVFLQYNSGESIRHLISDNESLLNELQIKNKLQQLQTDIIFSESALRDLVGSNDSQHMEEVNRENSVVQDDLSAMDTTIRFSPDRKLLDQLNFLMSEKIDNGNAAVQLLETKGKDAALVFIRTLRGRVIRDSIIQTISLINENRQRALSNISLSVSRNGASAKSWGIILALIACLASIVTFWYLLDEGQRQQKLIHTLDTSEKKLKQASKIQEQFVANISHEIRTPMNAVLGFAGLLQKTNLDKNQQEYVKSIRSSAENLLAIINDILDLSRIESGMMHIERLPFNVRELLDSVVTMMSVKAKNRGLFLNSEARESIPAILKGDAVRLTQILINLIANALKFTPQGGVVVRVEAVESKADWVRLRFEIADTGIGIEPAKQKTIFERFQQAQPEVTRRYGGTGLGLSIVKQLVEIQNGTISVASEPGKGATFTVDLPYQVASELEVASTFTVPLVTTKPPATKIKVLVAEDNQMNQKLIRHLFGQWQIDFSIAANGAEAVELLEQEEGRFDLVLMDIQMPEMDGYTATEKIRNDLHSQVPIIAMTAHALTGEREKCLGAGMDDYISKPLNEEQLYKLINKYAQVSFAEKASVIDLGYLQTISNGDKDFEKDMIESFAEQIPGELTELKIAIERKDLKKIAAVAHRMKSTVSYLGLQQLAPLLQAMESGSENGADLAEASDNFVLIDTACRLALKQARELIL